MEESVLRDEEIRSRVLASKVRYQNLYQSAKHALVPLSKLKFNVI